MRQLPSLIQIQERYIDAVNSAQPRWRALARGAARERAERDLRAWGYTQKQMDAVIDDARAMEELLRAWNEA